MDKYIGQMLDNRYEILEVIGVGGMAVVYKALCHRLNRLVAVKVLKDDFSQDADFRRRFHDESQAVAMLSHPNIVAVYDVSKNTEVEYIVMELIDGITLKQYMYKKGILNWREVLHFGSQIIKALSHAHSRGIIHRDIKPHNIMILRDGTVKVADFGIARFASKQNTLTQEALGSVHYISPEQARGSHIDARSDLYSVGVVLYEMLTGRLPFEGDTPVSVAIQHINSVPLNPKEVNPEIPDALEMITMKAMQPHVSKRYESAEAMLRDLDEFRKNPSINFEYDLTDARNTPSDEPTQVLPKAAHIAETVKQGKKPAAVSAAATTAEKIRRKNEYFEEENFKTKRNNSTVAMLTGILGVLAFLGIMAFVVVKLISSVVAPGEVDRVEVPNLLIKEFTSELEAEYPDLRFIAEYEYNADYTSGIILKQSVKSKEKVPPKTEIILTISKGPRKVIVPDLSNSDSQSAQFDLEALNLKFDFKKIKSDTVPANKIIETDPVAGTEVEEGKTITLVVSLGADVKQVFVPLVEGKDEIEAETELQNYGLNAVKTYVESLTVDAGYVISQDVPADTRVDEGAIVTLLISNGPPDAIPSVEPIVSPSVNPTESTTPTTESPTPATSEPPASPSPSTSTTDPVITKQITFSLPTTTGSTHVLIKVNSEIIYDETLDNGLGSHTQMVIGTPDTVVDVYFDGTFQFSKLLSE